MRKVVPALLFALAPSISFADQQQVSVSAAEFGLQITQMVGNMTQLVIQQNQRLEAQQREIEMLRKQLDEAKKPKSE